MFKNTLCIAILAAVCAQASADTGELEDPMRPYQPGASLPASVEQRFLLTATLVSDARQVAIVNGQPTCVGDEVDGAEVVAVGPSSVELRLGSRTFTVVLRSGGTQDE